MRRDLQPQIEPLVVSWGWRPILPAGSPFVQEQEWQGTRDIAAYLATPAAIQFTQEHDWDTVRAEGHALALYAQEKISALTGLKALSDASWIAQLVALPLPPCDAAMLKTRLYDEYRIEVPIVTWQDRQFVRLSLQAYNSKADVDALVQALGDILYRNKSLV